MVSEAERNERRRRAGERAATFVEDGMVVGLGTGRTADHATRALAARVAAGLRIVGVPTSHRTALLASSLGITVGSPEEHPRLDIAIDGADEVDPQLRLIKGLGGALLREKIVAAASARFIVVVDDGKLVSRPGSDCAGAGGGAAVRLLTGCRALACSGCGGRAACGRGGTVRDGQCPLPARLPIWAAGRS